MDKLKKSNYLANFDGAKVYVIGAGMVGKNSVTEIQRHYSHLQISGLPISRPPMPNSKP